MELGNQIKALRLERGVTQETVAAALGVSAQAVSKWETGAAAPDIALLPTISAYFGVSIDELFALSDETRLERIQNMLWNQREIGRADADSAAGFLLDVARRQPDSARPWALLAQLENHLADTCRAKAAEYAKTALERDSADHDGHSELVNAMGGKLPDWNVANHHELIDWYKGFLARHPDNWSGFMWLLDQLMDDFRFDEAETYLEKLAECDHTFRTPLYRGLLAWYRGDREEAQAVWDKMCADFPGEWCVWLSMGDMMARTGRYEEAKAHYRKALETQTPPRYTDATTSIAQVCELQGDPAGAIAACEEELSILREEWNTTSGEQTDHLRREIQRLRELL